MSRKRPYCLTIAGFDPSGGAGIVADTKTFEQLRVQGLSVITANTIQTEDQFFATNWVDLATIEQQLTALLERYPVRYIKIGLVENGTILLSILQLIHRLVERPFIIWDPVLTATAGGDLSADRFSRELAEILPKIDCIIPNLPEYEQLFGKLTAVDFVQQFKSMLYLKGGHSEERGKDFLFTQKAVYPFNSQINTPAKKHGTGCIVSAAILAHIAREFPLVKACLKSKRYVEKALISNETLLAYHSC